MSNQRDEGSGARDAGQPSACADQTRGGWEAVYRDSSSRLTERGQRRVAPAPLLFSKAARRRARPKSAINKVGRR